MMDYIIVQAGGKGTRLKQLTTNKPKALIPIDNLPMLFHLFQKFPDKRFIVISDYKKDVMRKYLQAFAEVKYVIVETEEKGTCAGIKKALELIPGKSSFMLIWSDLVLPRNFTLPLEDENYLGLSFGFRCRWKYENHVFEEFPSSTCGVAGVFQFKDKALIEQVPLEGEFVKWLQTQNLKFRTFLLENTKEYGVIEEFPEAKSGRCRPFNRMIFEEDRVVKEGIDEQGRKLALNEKAWYDYVKQTGYKNIPKIYSFEPFVMERIQGKNVFEYNLNRSEKKAVLLKLVESLNELHALEEAEADVFSMHQAYFTKTMERLNRIRNLVPFADQRTIRVNGRECRNVFYYLDELEKRVEQLSIRKFVLIHGDCTFSNIMLREGKEPVLIDPRGYFGFQKLLGDPLYDWAKLYYSLAGNYDQFNLRRFDLTIGEQEITLSIQSNGWEELEDIFLGLLPAEIPVEEIKLIHAIIWLSLTTYAWEDYDSICAAFYNGIYYLQELV